MSSEINILRLFKKNLVEFFDDLRSQFPKDPEVIALRIYLTDQVPVGEIMDTIIYKIEKLEEKKIDLGQMIKEKNEDFFLKHGLLFSEIKSQDSVNHFKNMWKSGNLNQEDKDTIFNYMRVFIKLIDNYRKVKSS